MGPGEALAAQAWKGHAQPSTVGRVVPGLAPGPTGTLGKEPKEAQAMPAGELLHADPKKGHDTDPCLRGHPQVLVPGLTAPGYAGAVRCRDSASHTYSPQSAMITFCFGFPSLLPWAFAGGTEEEEKPGEGG